MKRYFTHMQTKTPHQRRQHAAQMAFAVSALVFLGWLGTLGYRFQSNSSSVANENQSDQQTQLANVMNGAAAMQQDVGLEVATSTDGASNDSMQQYPMIGQ